MVSFGEKAKIKRWEIWIKVVVMFLQLYDSIAWYKYFVKNLIASGIMWMFHKVKTEKPYFFSS